MTPVILDSPELPTIAICVFFSAIFGQVLAAKMSRRGFKRFERSVRIVVGAIVSLVIGAFFTLAISFFVALPLSIYLVGPQEENMGLGIALIYNQFTITLLTVPMNLFVYFHKN